MGTGVLIIEDEPILAKNMQRFLARNGSDVRVAASCGQAIEALDLFQPDIILLDHNLPDGSGIDLLHQINASYPGPQTIFMTGHGSIQLAVDAMKAGAVEFVTKPLVLEQLALTIQSVSSRERKDEALNYLQSKGSKGGLDNILGESPRIALLKQQITALQQASAQLNGEAAPPVLICGETGTGKQLVARALHQVPGKKDAPFIELNCAALPEQLVESELFGHERGAFTDAKERKIGLIEAAQGGTLFLDEIGELALTTQAKLLKALESNTIRRIGSVREHPISVRIVAATNRDLRAMITQGTFRSDLYYRLQMLELLVPPLRERGTDIMVLAEHFLKMKARKYKRETVRLSGGALKALCAHNWPGNVRELRNTIERAILLSPASLIDVEQLALPAARPEPVQNSAPQEPQSLPEMEKSALLQALNRSGWNVSEASRLLGVSRDTLRYRIEKFDLRPGAPH